MVGDEAEEAVEIGGLNAGSYRKRICIETIDDDVLL